MYLFGGFLIRVDLLTCGCVSVIVTGLGDGQLASGSGSWTGLLGGVTNDGEAGESGVSLCLGVAGIGELGIGFTTGSGISWIIGLESKG